MRCCRKLHPKRASPNKFYCTSCILAVKALLEAVADPAEGKRLGMSDKICAELIVQLQEAVLLPSCLVDAVDARILPTLLHCMRVYGVGVHNRSLSESMLFLAVLFRVPACRAQLHDDRDIIYLANYMLDFVAALKKIPPTFQLPERELAGLLSRPSLEQLCGIFWGMLHTPAATFVPRLHSLVAFLSDQLLYRNELEISSNQSRLWHFISLLYCKVPYHSERNALVEKLLNVDGDLMWSVADTSQRVAGSIGVVCSTASLAEREEVYDVHDALDVYPRILASLSKDSTGGILSFLRSLVKDSAMGAQGFLKMGLLDVIQTVLLARVNKNVQSNALVIPEACDLLSELQRACGDADIFTIGKTATSAVEVLQLVLMFGIKAPLGWSAHEAIGRVTLVLTRGSIIASEFLQLRTPACTWALRVLTAKMVEPLWSRVRVYACALLCDLAAAPCTQTLFTESGGFRCLAAMLQDKRFRDAEAATVVCCAVHCFAASSEP